MKRLLCILLLSFSLLYADSVALDLTLLHDELEQLSKKLPKRSLTAASPSALLQQIQQGTILRSIKSTPSVAAQQVQEQVITDLAKKYRAFPGMVRKIVEEVAGPHELQKIQNTLDISNNDAWAPLKEIKRRLNLHLERQGSRVFTGGPKAPDVETIPEADEPESQKRDITEKDKDVVAQLKQDILKHFKKEFPALTLEDANKTAEYFFENRVVTKWELRNRATEQEAVKLIKELLKNQPQTSTTVQPKQSESITQKEQQESIAAIVALHRSKSDEASSDDWET
jgi:hypothetical protein